MWVSGLTAALSVMPTSRLWAVGRSVSWPEKGSAPRAGAQLSRRDRPLVVLQLLGRARGSPRVPWGCPQVGGAAQWPLVPCCGDSRGRSLPSITHIAMRETPGLGRPSPRDRWGRSQGPPLPWVHLGDSGYGARPDLGSGAWLRNRHLRSPLTAMGCSRSLGHPVCSKRINDNYNSNCSKG